MRRALSSLRAFFAAYAVATFAYALLAYDPFTYTQVIKFELLPGLSAFARWHRFLYWPAQLAAVLSIWPALQAGHARVLARAYLAVAVAGGLALLLLQPLLPGLQSDARSLAVGLVALLPVAWLAAIDLGHAWRDLPPAEAPPDPARQLLFSSLLAGLLVYALFSTLAVLRGERPSVLLFYSLALHLLCALAVGAALLLASAPAGLRAQLTLGTALVAAVLGVATRRALGAIAFPPGAAPWVAAALGAVLALALLGLAVRKAGNGPARNGLALLLSPLSLPEGLPALLRVVLPLALCGAVARLAISFDWNFLLQQGSAVAAWLLVVSALVTFRRQAPLPATSGWLAVSTALALGAALAARGLAGARGLPEQLVSATALDPSLRALAPAAPSSNAGGSAFYELLSRHTNLPSATRIAPLDVQLSPAPLAATPGTKPDIYLFVMDSLRRDYLPPYSPQAASFAPGVAAFARDAVVFRDAFTRYGATGLSEPSIWVGGMTPHKQYVTPFGPMNALAKLLIAEDYRALVSVDAILEAVLPPWPGLVKLDAKIPNKDYALCRSLGELQQKLQATPRKPPAFAFTQAQDIHVSRIAREGPQVPAGATFPPGFNPPVAARIQRWDACFGAFVKWLDQSGRGDDAIVVLTADHGDSLGEEGRFGHAYTIYPEVVRVPLLVRFPKAWRGRVRCRPEELAFTADLTPTIYDLLGHPVQEKPPFGAPLCALDKDPPARHQGPQLVVSSYGPVYGLVEQGGARLYIADAVNYREEAFALGDGPPQRLSLTDQEKGDAQRTVIDQLKQLEAAYGMAWE